jgi:hypothetical protein
MFRGGFFSSVLRIFPKPKLKQKPARQSGSQKSEGDEPAERPPSEEGGYNYGLKSVNWLKRDSSAAQAHASRERSGGKIVGLLRSE